MEVCMYPTLSASEVAHEACTYKVLSSYMPNMHGHDRLVIHIYACSQTYHTMSCILHQAIHVHIVIHAKPGHKFTVGDFMHAWHIGTLNTFIALVV